MKQKNVLILLAGIAMVLTACGQASSHEHSFSNEWSTNELTHWHAATCSHKEYSKDVGNHVDENKDGKCDVCLYEIPVTPVPHEHTFSNDWSKNETSHWHAATCGHSEFTKDLAEHTFGDGDRCTVCGQEKPTPGHVHTFSGEWSKNETSHWHQATCEHTYLTSDLAAHTYGVDNKCTVCGAEKPAGPHEHSFSSEWSDNESCHWHSATCEHTELSKDLGEHTYGNDNKCTVCGMQKPTPGHVHTYSDVWSKNNEVHWHASSCGHDDYTKDLGEHTYGNDDKCTVCGFSKPLPPHEHSFSNEWSANDVSHWHAATCEHIELTKDMADHIDSDKDGKCDVCTYIIPVPVNHYRVTFDSNGGTPVDSVLVEENTPVKKPDDPTYESYIFDCWCSDVYLLVKYDFDLPVTKHMTLYARYRDAYDIVYHVGKEAENNPSNEYVYNVDHIPALLSPYKEGYPFLGWYEDAEFTKKIEELPSVPRDIDLYAKWGETQHYFIARFNDGKLTYTYEDSKPEPSNNTFILPNNFFEIRRWGYESISEQITSVLIDESVKTNSSLLSTAGMFSLFTNCASIVGLENLNTSNVYSANCMFYRFGYKLNTFNYVPDVNCFAMNNVMDISKMFEDYGGSSTNLDKVPDVSKWNTSSVLIMDGVFKGYGFSSSTLVKTPDVSNWNAENCFSFNRAFAEYGFTSPCLEEAPDISKWNCESASNLIAMFESYGISSEKLNFYLDFKDWDFSTAESLNNMFANSGFKAKTWEVIIPEISGFLINSETILYGNSKRCFAKPTSNRLFTVYHGEMELL